MSSPQDWASAEQSLSSIASYVSVKAVDEVESKGEFAYKEMRPLQDLGERREGGDVQWDKLGSFGSLAGW